MATKTAEKIEYYEKKLADAEKRLEQYKIDGDTNRQSGVGRKINFYKQVIDILERSEKGNTKLDVTVDEENETVNVNSTEEYFIKYFSQDKIDEQLKRGNFVKRDGRIFDYFGTFEVQLKPSDSEFTGSGNDYLKFFDDTYSGGLVGLGTTTKTVVVSVTPYVTKEIVVPIGFNDKPNDLSAFQIASYTDLIKINPEGWETQIGTLKSDWPDLFGDQNPYTDLELSKFDGEQFNLYLNNKETLTKAAKEKTEEDAAKKAWLEKTKDSPAAKSGAFTDDERWELHKKNNPDAIKDASGVGSDSETTGTKVIKANPCKNNFLSDVETTIDNFINLISRAKNIDIAGEIKGVTNLISGKAKKFVGQMGNALAEGLSTWAANGLDMGASKIFNAIPKFSKALKAVTGWQKGLIGPIKKIFDSVSCLAGKVTLNLKGVLTDMLTGMAKNVLNGVKCAVQQFVGAITNKITSMIDGFVSPFTNPLSKLMGGAFKIKGLLGKGINMMNKVKNFFSCESTPAPCPTTDNYTIDGTAAKSSSSSEQQGFMAGGFKSANNAFDKIDRDGGVIGALVPGEGKLTDIIDKKANKFEEKYGKWKIFGSQVSDAESNQGTQCYAGNIFKCGFPKITLFGGNGVGGAGKVLLGKYINKIDPEDLYGDIRRTASIVGVELDDPGEGYTEEPLVSFTDNCNQGQGAYGKAIIDKNISSPTYGQITDIVMTSQGENYPVDSPAIASSVYIDKIIVENPGIGYQAAYIDDECLELNIKNGAIESVDIKCRKPYTYIPELLIINPGYGAVLRPVMSATRRVVEEQLAQSIDCVGDYPSPGEL